MSRPKSAAPAPGKAGQIVSRNKIAELFGVSPATVDRWMKSGCPTITRGGRGIECQLDVPTVARWWAANIDKGRVDADAPDFDPDTLPASERKNWYDGEIRKRDLQVRDRELIPADEVSDMLAETFKAVGAALENIPDLLERDCGLTGSAVTAVQQAVDAARQILYNAAVGEE